MDPSRNLNLHNTFETSNGLGFPAEENDRAASPNLGDELERILGPPVPDHHLQQTAPHIGGPPNFEFFDQSSVRNQASSAPLQNMQQHGPMPNSVPLMGNIPNMFPLDQGVDPMLNGQPYSINMSAGGKTQTNCSNMFNSGPGSGFVGNAVPFIPNFAAPVYYNMNDQMVQMKTMNPMSRNAISHNVMNSQPTYPNQSNGMFDPLLRTSSQTTASSKSNDASSSHTESRSSNCVDGEARLANQLRHETLDVVFLIEQLNLKNSLEELTRVLKIIIDGKIKTDADANKEEDWAKVRENRANMSRTSLAISHLFGGLRYTVEQALKNFFMQHEKDTLIFDNRKRLRESEESFEMRKKLRFTQFPVFSQQILKEESCSSSSEEANQREENEEEDNAVQK